MASMILEADEDSVEADPGRLARRQELPGADQRAFRDQGAALLTYRERARTSLIEPLETMFPVLKSLLDMTGDWEPCVEGFLEARVVRSGHYRDIAPSFLGWLAATGWGQERWPFLLELAHLEIMEVLVARYPDSDPPEGLKPDPGASDLVVLDPATQVVSYPHAVHQAREESPVLLELTPATSALLVMAQTRTLTQAAQALNLPDLAPLMELLRDLCRKGAVAGFQPPT